MGRPRQYESAAARQQACRQREQETVRVELRALDGLYLRLERLQQVLRQAAAAGNETAQAGGVISVEIMLKKLVHHFERLHEAQAAASAPPAPAAPRRN